MLSAVVLSHCFLHVAMHIEPHQHWNEVSFAGAKYVTVRAHACTLPALLPAGSRFAGRPVAIDSCVARRPPALKSNAEDCAAERLAQLLLLSSDVAAEVLRQVG